MVYDGIPASPRKHYGTAINVPGLSFLNGTLEYFEAVSLIIILPLHNISNDHILIYNFHLKSNNANPWQEITTFDHINETFHKSCCSDNVDPHVKDFPADGDVSRYLYQR